MSYWVIKFDNGSYNCFGRESHLSECTKYTTKEDAEKVAEELSGVESIFQIAIDEKKDYEDEAVLIVSDLLNAGIIQNEEDDFNYAVNMVMKRLKLIKEAK
jgi:hypothetical protein